MNTEQFLNLVLPRQGYRCLAKPQEHGFAHHILPTNVDAATRANWLDYTKNDEVFFACGSLREEFVIRKIRGAEKKVRRVKENIFLLKSFWLDIDCGKNLRTGEQKAYPDQKAAIESLVKFLKYTGLPRPLVVNSGYGLHVYFPLQQEVTSEQWSKVARMLKAVTEYFGLQADRSRTQDTCSILRPVGTRNKKDPANPKLVRAVPSQYEIVDFIDFAKRLAGLIKKHGIPLEAPKHSAAAPVAASSTNDLIGGIQQHSASTAAPIAESCAAMALMRDTRGNVSEPLWYSLIGILRHTVDAPQIIHDWSRGHPEYSESETVAKIEQHETQGAGPTSCQHIRSATEAGALCQQCPHFGRITSPIQLGRVTPAAPPKVELPTQLASPSEEPVKFAPKDIGRFELTPSGIYFKDSFEPGAEVEQETKVLVLEYPLIVKTSAEDERQGGVIELECRHPNKGLHSFFVEKSVLAEKSSFNKALLKNHVAVSASKVDMMRDYTISYLQELDRNAELQMLYSTMGWKDDKTFILGTRCIRKDRAVEQISLGLHLEDNYCSSIKPVGALDKWVENTAILNQDGFERHALSLLWGFGAPLMRLTGFEGATVNLWGRSNAGKSTMLHWATSIYGDYSQLKAQKKDTVVSLMGRLGTLNNLPLVLDEITNIDPKDVSDLIHDISQGREKARMTKNVTDRKPRTWNTLAIMSSNSTLTDKLLSAKDDPEAERLRLIEYFLPNIPEFEALAPQIHGVLSDNYGTAGEVFLQYVVNNIDPVKNVMKAIHKIFCKNTDAQGKERFWVAAVSAALTGGYIAEKLGLIQFNVAKIQKKAEEIMVSMREDLQTTHVEFSSVLGRYLNTHSQNVIFLKYGVSSGKEVVEAVYEPARELFVRVEHIGGGKRVYADKQHLLRWLQKQAVSSSEFVRETKQKGLLLDLNRKVILGAGWPNNPSNATIPTIMFFLPDAEEVSRAVDTTHLRLVK